MRYRESTVPVPAGSVGAVVLVYPCGEGPFSPSAVRGLLTEADGVLVLDPPATLTDTGVEIVASVVGAPAVSSGPPMPEVVEIVPVVRGLRFRDVDGTVSAVLLLLATPSAYAPEPLGTDTEQFLAVLRDRPPGSTAAAAFVAAGLLEPDRAEPVSDEVREVIDEARTPRWDDQETGGDQDGPRWWWICWITSCKR